jgi:hypothetical protein
MSTKLVIHEKRWDGYQFNLTFRNFELACVEVERAAGAAPLSAQMLQRVPLGGLERAARKQAAQTMTEFINLQPEPARATAFPGARAWHDRSPRAEDSKIEDREVLLSRLAKRYVETVGQSQQTRLLAEWSRADPERGHYSEGSIPQLIREARKRLLLTPTRKGKSGGELTPKALVLLGEIPAKRATAWEQATPEQREAAFERERIREERQAALLAERRAGLIDAETFGLRGLEIDRQAEKA